MHGQGQALAQFGYPPASTTSTLGPSGQMISTASTMGPSAQPHVTALTTSAPRNDLFTKSFQARQVPPAVGRDEPGVTDVKKDGTRQLLAYMFTLVAFVIFSGPIVVSITLATDNDVAYWIGTYGYFAILVPVFLFGQHVYHLWMLRNHRLTRYVFLLTPLLPAALFMFIGGTYMSRGKYLYGQLKSDDCHASSSVPEKHWLQVAYEEARDGWEKCVERKKLDNRGVPLRRIPTLQSCSEWDAMVDNVTTIVPWKGYRLASNSMRVRDPSNLPRWQYLANSEINHMCSGFCEGGPALWTISQKLGSEGSGCAEIVAFRFVSVMQYGLMVFTIGAIVFLLTFPIYFSAKSFLAGLGYSSSTTLA